MDSMAVILTYPMTYEKGVPMDAGTMVRYNQLLERHGVNGSFGWMGLAPTGCCYFKTDDKGDIVIAEFSEGLDTIESLKEIENATTDES